MFQSLLEKYNLTYDQLNTSERETVMRWAKALETKTLTPEDIKAHINSLIVALEKDLAGLEAPTSLWAWLFTSKRDIYLKARLKNYLLLQDLLSGPERARQFIEAHLQNFKSK